MESLCHMCCRDDAVEREKGYYLLHNGCVCARGLILMYRCSNRFYALPRSPRPHDLPLPRACLALNIYFLPIKDLPGKLAFLGSNDETDPSISVIGNSIKDG
ncbi:unnamed protein product [Arctia plantaginis]|uniref:Uncharacterized protein n=1 Tax=Arctia plantaginis TaxID=874455 RepID=A0A8S0YRU6_ARCPL|nr:unnamed protein product [Arctia plantaginis]CAB3243540.1 unnamed protein product [Arctia plantaginis]